MKRTTAFAIMVICLFAIFALQYKAMQSTQANAELLSLVRDTPAKKFYPSLMLVLAFVVAPVLFIVLRVKHWSHVASQGSIRNAQKVARSLWLVDGEPKIEGDWVVLRFAHLSWNSRHFVLPVRPGHPDILRFRNLEKGQTVEFEPLSEGMECALENELCGYLRIKNVSQ